MGLTTMSARTCFKRFFFQNLFETIIVSMKSITAGACKNMNVCKKQLYFSFFIE